MKVALFSDLHTEFDPGNPWTPGQLDADVIVFAGDNVTSPAQLRNFARTVEQTQKNTAQMLYVCGNHEFYGGSIRFGARAYEKYREALAGCSRSRLLEMQSTEIDGVRFIGATMWTPVKDSVSLDFNDYRYIRIDRAPYRRLRPADVRERYRQTTQFLEDALATEAPTVVVTHHPPSRIGLDLEPEDPWTADLEDMIERSRALAWLHGHVHRTHADRLGRTLIVSNPRGYFPDHLNPEFNPSYILTV